MIKLDRRVTIQALSVTESGIGEAVGSWANVRTESASYHPGSGAERRISAQEQANHPATFEFHASALTRSLAPQTHRLVFDGDTWNITSAVEVRRNRRVSVVATRRVS